MSGLAKFTFPIHAAASQIAEHAKRLGCRVERSAASGFSRSAYVFADDIKIRIADHPPGKRRRFDIDVDPAGERVGAVLPDRVIRVLRRMLCARAALAKAEGRKP